MVTKSKISFFISFSTWFVVVGINAVPSTRENCNIMYVGFPGLSAEYHAFMGKYNTGYQAHTGEFVCSEAIDIVHPSTTQVIQFPEIINPENCSRFGRWWNSFFRRQTWTRHRGSQLVPPLRSSDSQRPLYSVTSYGVNRKNVNMGQERDITCVREQLEETFPEKDYLKTKSVWVAYSRGVGVALRYAATLCPRVRLPQALVLEGGIDSIPHIYSHMFDNYLPAWMKGDCKPSFILSILRWGFKKFYAPAYNESAEEPDYTLECIKKIPAHIPVLLVTSKGDELVSYRSTLRMYCAFKKARGENGNNVHLLILNNARHSHYVNGVNNVMDRDNYEQCVHAFYKHYGFSYKEELANKGAGLFGTTNNVDVLGLLKGARCSVCTTSQW